MTEIFSYKDCYLDERILKDIYSKIYTCKITKTSTIYYKNNRFYRYGDNPAIVRIDGSEEYWNDNGFVRIKKAQKI